MRKRDQPPRLVRSAELDFFVDASDGESWRSDDTYHCDTDEDRCEGVSPNDVKRRQKKRKERRDRRDEREEKQWKENYRMWFVSANAKGEERGHIEMDTACIVGDHNHGCKLVLDDDKAFCFMVGDAFVNLELQGADTSNPRDYYYGDTDFCVSERWWNAFCEVSSEHEDESEEESEDESSKEEPEKGDQKQWRCAICENDSHLTNNCSFNARSDAFEPNLVGCKWNEARGSQPSHAEE